MVSKLWESSMNKRIYRFVVIVLSVVVSIFCIALFTACNDTRRYSNEIFITDFSGTFRLSLDVKVQKHTFFPREYNSFVYKKGLDALYNELVVVAVIWSGGFPSRRRFDYRLSRKQPYIQFHNIFRQKL